MIKKPRGLHKPPKDVAEVDTPRDAIDAVVDHELKREQNMLTRKIGYYAAEASIISGSVVSHVADKNQFIQGVSSGVLLLLTTAAMHCIQNSATQRRWRDVGRELELQKVTSDALAEPMNVIYSKQKAPIVLWQPTEIVDNTIPDMSQRTETLARYAEDAHMQVAVPVELIDERHKEYGSYTAEDLVRAQKQRVISLQYLSHPEDEKARYALLSPGEMRALTKRNVAENENPAGLELYLKWLPNNMQLQESAAQYQRQPDSHALTHLRQEVLRALDQYAPEEYTMTPEGRRMKTQYVGWNTKGRVDIFGTTYTSKQILSVAGVSTIDALDERLVDEAATDKHFLAAVGMWHRLTHDPEYQVARGTTSARMDTGSDDVYGTQDDTTLFSKIYHKDIKASIHERYNRRKRIASTLAGIAAVASVSIWASDINHASHERYSESVFAGSTKDASYIEYMLEQRDSNAAVALAYELPLILPKTGYKVIEPSLAKFVDQHPTFLKPSIKSELFPSSNQHGGSDSLSFGNVGRFSDSPRISLVTHGDIRVDGYWTSRVTDSVIIDKNHDPYAVSRDQTVQVVPQERVEDSRPYVTAEFPTRFTQSRVLDLPARLDTRVVGVTAIDDQGRNLETILMKDRKGSYSVQIVNDRGDTARDGIVKYTLVEDSRATLPISTGTKVMQTGSQGTYRVRPTGDESIHEAYARIHKKEYARNPLKDDDALKAGSVDDLRLRLREQEATVCNLAALELELSIPFSGDGIAPLSITEGYRNVNGDNTLSSAERHAWNIDKLGAIVDATPSLRVGADGERGMQHPIIGGLVITALLGEVARRRLKKRLIYRTKHGKSAVANQTASLYESALWSDPQVRVKATDARNTDALQRILSSDISADDMRHIFADRQVGTDMMTRAGVLLLEMTRKNS